MGEYTAVIAIVAGIEPIPQGPQHGRAAETEILYFCDVILVDAAQRHDFPIDDALLGGGANFFGGVRCLVVFFGEAVKYRTEEHVVAPRLVLLHFFQRMAGAADVSRVAGRRVGVAGIQVDAFQSVFLLQEKMVVDDDASVKPFRDEGQQALCEQGNGAGLPQVENFQSFLEKSGDDLVFLHEIRGGRYQDEFHIVQGNDGTKVIIPSEYSERFRRFSAGRVVTAKRGVSAWFSS